MISSAISITQSVILPCNITFTAPFLPPSHVASLVVVVTQFFAALQNSNKIKQLFTNIDFYAHAAYIEEEERSVFCLTLSLGLNRNHIHVVLSATILVCNVPRTLPCPARSACVRIKVNLFLQRNIIPLKILKVEMCSQYWPAKYFSAIGRHTNPSIYRCTKILDFRKSLVKENVVLNWDSYIIVGLVSSTTLLQWKSSEHISFHCKIVHLSWLFICTFN